MCALLLLFYLQQPAHPEVSRAGSQGSGAEEGRDLQGVPPPPPPPWSASGAHVGVGLPRALPFVGPSLNDHCYQALGVQWEQGQPQPREGRSRDPPGAWWEEESH